MSGESLARELSTLTVNDWFVPIDRANEICTNAVDAIGQTPLVYLNSITKDLKAKIAVKLEFNNPACSVKDRPGSYMIQKAEREGKIHPGRTVLIEGTSGNMGIALAWSAAVKGYKIVLVMTSNMSLERKTLLKAYGAEFVLVDPEKGFVGVMERVHELARLIPNSYVLNQFANPANVESHYLTTGPEIWRQTKGKVDIVVFGVGSGGTMSGVGRYLKSQNPKVRIFAVEPYESSVLNGFPPGKHCIYGTGTGMIPQTAEPVYEQALRVHTDEAVIMAKRLAREEGLLGGLSGGANVCAAVKLAQLDENCDKIIVTNLPDFGERYLSTLLYNDLKEECEAIQVESVEENLKYLSKTLGI